MATAGYDGELCVWNLETEKIYLRLRQGQVSDMYDILFVSNFINTVELMCNPTPEISNILWHPTKIYVRKYFCWLK